MTLSIVIPVYNRWDLVHSLLFDIHNTIQDIEYEIIVVDDKSTDIDIGSGIGWWQKSGLHKTLRYISHTTNKGFSATCNTGIKAAKMDNVAVVSSDVGIKRPWMSILDSLLYLNSTGIYGGDYIKYDTKWNDIPELGGIIPYLAGWFIATSRSNWIKLRGFDEGFYRFDYEDVELSYRASKMGFLLEEFPKKCFIHVGGASINQLDLNRQEITLKNRQYFIDKWSKNEK